MSVGLGWVHAGDLAKVNTCGTSLPAGASCIITVALTPTAKGEPDGIGIGQR